MNKLEEEMLTAVVIVLLKRTIIRVVLRKKHD
jgi:hypothetical protein